MNPPAPPTTALVPAAQAEPLNVQQVGNLIRYWVHYDNTIQALNKQVNAARSMKKNYESQILTMFRAANMTSPVVQIGGGGRLIVGEDRTQESLSFSTLERILHEYYAKRPGKPDETSDIIKFVRANRQTTTAPCLKRQGAGRSRSKSVDDTGKGI